MTLGHLTKFVLKFRPLGMVSLEKLPQDVLEPLTRAVQVSLSLSLSLSLPLSPPPPSLSRQARGAGLRLSEWTMPASSPLPL